MSSSAVGVDGVKPKRFFGSSSSSSHRRHHYQDSRSPQRQRHHHSGRHSTQSHSVMVDSEDRSGNENLTSSPIPATKSHTRGRSANGALTSPPSSSPLPLHPNPPALSHNVRLFSKHSNNTANVDGPTRKMMLRKGVGPVVKRAIDDLNKAIKARELRIAAITNACDEFDHWDEEKHSIELGLNAANVLSQLLSMTDDDDEIRMICAALEMIYRSSHDSICKSFADIGNTLVPLLLRLLERCETGGVRFADVSIMNITKVLLYFSRVPKLRVMLTRQQGMIDAIVRISFSILNPDCRIFRMKVLANLANAEDNRLPLYEHHGLIDSILKVANLDLCDSVREYAATVLMELASLSAIQVPMTNDDRLLSTLVKLMASDDTFETREYATTALQNLAYAKDNRIRLTSYNDGAVLEGLKKTMTKDKNEKARLRAAGALMNLACDDTAERMGVHDGLLVALADVSTSDNSNDVQKRATLALTKMAGSISSQMACYIILLDALVKAASSENGASLAAVFRAKAKLPENRYAMAQYPGVLECLANIISSNSYSYKDRENAMRSIVHLSNANANRRLMTNRIVLDMLVKSASITKVEEASIRDSAITALQRIATDIPNRKIMARHDGLIVAIAKATERESKIERPRSHSSKDQAQKHLAKPLLMSLLLEL
eukprot:CAMPEP_0194381728 /NCGR_PEP_ID=MMETSP0174-20130528/55425_1 /TAXON_ID=216777 /ORGANISM="Proboscia alata, Strain PI-D3" /LENGTH=662 /DNA_ID=CAMNT_0039166345 /DNA_START=113 /DNA_END=2101 /DNA_ORIENTATION=-